MPSLGKKFDFLPFSLALIFIQKMYEYENNVKLAGMNEIRFNCS